MKNNYQKYKESIKATNQARRDAVKILIDRHRNEFDLLYVEEATKRGLNPVKTVNQLKREEEESAL